MTHVWKRSISMLLALVMVFGMLPTFAFAEEEVFEEQSYVEEPVAEEPAEEPAAEEPVAEEPAAEEPVAEESAAEEPEEEPISFEEIASQYVADVLAMAVDEDEEIDGYIWLDGGLTEDEIRNYILANGLSGMICEALGEKGEWDVAFEYEYTYMGVSGKVNVSMGVPDIFSLSDAETAAWVYLAGEVKEEGNIEFVLKKGDERKSCVVGFRSINRVNIEITPDNKTIAAEEYDAAAVEDAKSGYAVSITYNNKSGGKETIPVEVAEINFADVVWPEDNATNEVDPFITATIVDSMHGTDYEEGTASLTLTDTTLVYTVKYDLGGGNIVAAKSLAEGKATPSYESVKGEAPAKKYYTFAGWDREVAATIAAADANAAKEIIYTAKWTPVNDVNGNTIADEEDSFKIIYKDKADGSIIAEYDQHAGEKTKIPADPAGYTVDGTEWQFVEWSPAPSEFVQATPNNEATVYVAQWTADHRVNFLMHDNTKKVTTVETGESVIAQEHTYKYKTSAGTWYYADAEGNYIDVEGQKAPVEYDFSTPVTGDLYLKAEWYEDRNENKIEDGTSFDPIHRHTWYGVDGTVVEEKIWVVGDLVTDESDLVCTYKAEGYYFNGWLDEPAVDLEEDGRMYIQYTHRPNKPVKDVNSNKIDDALETIKLDIPVESAGKGTVTVKATNLIDNGDGTYVYDSRPGYEFCRNITIIATPVVNGDISESYVAEIKVNGETKTPTYKNYVATCSYTVGAAVAPVAEGKAVSGETIQVTFADAQLTLKTDNVMQYIVGQTDAKEDEIYNAAVEAPAYDAAAVESLKYLARAAATKPVSVDGIKEQINSFELPSAAATMISAEKFNELKQKALDKLNELAPGGKYDVDLDAVWLNVDAKIEEVSMEKVVDDAAKKVMNSVMSSVLEDVDYASKNMNAVMQDALDEFERTINVQATMADCHVFGRNTGAGDIVAEQLKIVYQNEKMRVVAENVPIKLQDKRTATKITASDVEIYYGTEFDPLKHAKLTTMGGTAVGGLELDGDYEDLIPGTYTVYLKFDGNNEFKPSKGSYKLTIVGPTITVSVADQVISDNADVIKAKAKPVIKNEKGEEVEFDSITGLHVVAGYDVTKADSLNFENNSLSVKAYAKVKMSEKLESLLTAAGINMNKVAGSHTLQEFLDILNNDLKMQLPAEIKSSLESVLTSLKMDNEDVKVQVDICDDATEPYPANPGAYLNLVYAVEDGIISVAGKNPVSGWIVYTPAVYIPDNGIELTYNGVGGHKLEIPSDAANKELKVMRGSTVLSAGEYSIYYVGVTGDGESYMDSKAPTADGIYFVGAVDLRAEQNRISTDCALVTIGLKQGKLTIDNLTKVEEKPGVNYVPDIQANDGAALTMISGTIGVDVDELKQLTDEMTQENIEKLIGAFYGSVHIELPDAIYSKLAAAWKKVAANEVVFEHIEKMPATMPEKANPAHVLKVLKYLQDANNKVVDETLGRIQRVDKYVDEVMTYVNAVYNKLYYAVDLLDDKVTVSMNSDRQAYSAAGIYAYVGIVTDPTFIPDVDAGVLVIENGETFELGENKFMYDGNGHMPELIDMIDKGNMMIIKQDNVFNFLLDGDLEMAVVNKLEKWLNKDLSGTEPKFVTVDELYATGDDVAEKLADIVLEELEVRAKALLDAKFGGRGKNALNTAISTLENRLLPTAKNYLINKFKALDGLRGNAKAGILIKGALPVNAGEYPVCAISYGLAVEQGTMVIKPLVIDAVELDQYDFTYSGSEWTVNVTAKDSDDNVVVDPKYYDVTGISGTEVGTYKVIVTAKSKYAPNVTGSAEAEWTISQEVLDKKNAELAFNLTYNGEEQEQKVIVTNAAGTVLTEGVDYLLKDNKKTNAGDNYVLTVEGIGHYAGSFEMKWSIARKPIDQTTVTVGELTYNGNPQIPTVVITDGAETLVDGTDYIVAVGYETNAGEYELTIMGQGNYTGALTGIKWTIAAKEITVTVDDITTSVDEAVPVITPVVVDADGNAITDADITITITDADGNPVDLAVAAKTKGVYTITVTVGNTNYVVSAASDLEAILKVKSYVAQVGTIKYETLQEAVDAVEDGGTIQLLDNAGLALVQKSVTIVRNGFSATVAALEGYTVETSAEYYIVKPITEIENPTGAALAYVDLNGNGTFDGEEVKQTINDALQTADIQYKGAYAVRLTQNIEGENAEVSVLIPGGVTLDLQGYTLETRYLTGLTKSTFTGTLDNAAGAGGSLKIPKDNLALPFNVIPYEYYGFDMMPIYDLANQRYTFGVLNIVDNGSTHGLTLTEDTLTFRFACNTTPYIKSHYLNTYGMENCKLDLIARVEWDIPGEGTAHLDFAYKNGFVLEVLNEDNRDFILTIKGYKELGIKEGSKLRVYGVFASDSGIETTGEVFREFTK